MKCGDKRATLKKKVKKKKPQHIHVSNWECSLLLQLRPQPQDSSSIKVEVQGCAERVEVELAERLAAGVQGAVVKVVRPEVVEGEAAAEVAETVVRLYVSVVGRYVKSVAC